MVLFVTSIVDVFFVCVVNMAWFNGISCPGFVGVPAYPIVMSYSVGLALRTRIVRRGVVLVSLVSEIHPHLLS